jgi:methionine sulfoxide reductase heme-binding subunit
MGVPRRRRILHAGVVSLALLPLAALAVGAWRGTLGANPVETVTHETGHWALRLLLASLAVTPLRSHLRLAALAPYRRTLGLLAFLYASLHLATYVVLDLGLDLSHLAADVLERPFVTAGFAAWALLLPLALTSTRAMQRRLGRRWIALHRLAYLAPACAVIHFLWLVKADLRGPLLYAALLAGLLAARWRPRRRRASPSVAGCS